MIKTVACAFPGCQRPRAEPTAATGRRPSYCDDPAHDRESARRERVRLREEGQLPDVDPGDRPVALASATLDGAAESMAARVAELRELADRVEAAAATVADQTAVDLELDAVRATSDLELARLRSESLHAQQQASAALAAAEQQATAAAARRDALAGELELIRGEHTDLTDRVAEQTDELIAVRADRDQQLATLTTQLAEQQSAATTAHAALEAQHEELAARLQSLERELAGAHERLAERAGELTELQQHTQNQAERLGETTELLAAERARRETLEAVAHTAEQLVAAEQARAHEARAGAVEARAERDRALQATTRAQAHADRAAQQVVELEKRLAVAEAHQPPPARAPAARARKSKDGEPGGTG